MRVTDETTPKTPEPQADTPATPESQATPPEPTTAEAPASEGVTASSEPTATETVATETGATETGATETDATEVPPATGAEAARVAERADEPMAEVAPVTEPDPAAEATADLATEAEPGPAASPPLEDSEPVSEPSGSEVPAMLEEPDEAQDIASSVETADAGPAAPAPEAPAEPAPAEPAPAEAAPAEPAPAEPAPAPATPAAPKPAPPKPGPVPTPAILRTAHKPAVAVVVDETHSDSARFGRVDEAGHVFVQEGDSEREVGSYPDATPEEALQYFARKYDELAAAAELLHQRLTSTELSAREAGEGLAKLKEQAHEPNVVGDLAALATRITEIEGLVAARRETETQERAVAKEAARVEREAIVAEAERIAGQPEDRIQWKSSGERMRALLDQWKAHQRSGVKLDKDVENALWQRFSKARNGFDKARRAWFAQLETTRSEAKSTKESLVAEAEALATSDDWGPTAGAFKRLMDRWRTAGRASRSDDDALWARFKAAQDAFFAAKDQVAAAEDEEFRANLAVKEQLLTEAQAILPVKDLETAKTSLRSIQERWEAAGKVPRGDVERVEKGLRKVESAVRDAEDHRWTRTNPEIAARAQSLVSQLEAAVADLRTDLERAEASGNARKVAEAKAALEAREQWLAQARAGLDEFSG